jgi:RNA polymerase sigma-70 factor (ECF subfamily)
VSSYERFLNQLARRQEVPERHIPDVTQQILLTIAKSIDSWKDDGNAASFRRWLSTVSRNVAIRFMLRECKQAGGVGGSDLVAVLQNVVDKPEEQHVRQYEHELIVWAAEQVRHEFWNPELPLWFDMIVTKLLMKSASDRFASSEAVAQIFEE